MISKIIVLLLWFLGSPCVSASQDDLCILWKSFPDQVQRLLQWPCLDENYDHNPCSNVSWRGVECSAREPVSLDLSNLKLKGGVPKRIFSISSLQRLILSGNHFSGLLPNVWDALPCLQEVHLHDNEFSGALPSTLVHHSHLRLLKVHHNRLDIDYDTLCSSSIEIYIEEDVPLVCKHRQLSGTHGLCDLASSTNLLLNAPSGWACSAGSPSSDICTWSFVTCNGQNVLVGLHIEALYDVSGSLPSGISKLDTLQTLVIESNKMTGSIPNAISALVSLTRLSLTDNIFGGLLPGALTSLTNLEILNLHGNQIGDTLLNSYSALVSLKDLTLNNNGFEGVIPTGFGNLMKLTRLHVFANHLTGALPSTLTKLSNLVELKLHGNKLNGAYASEMCTSVMSKLSTFTLTTSTTHQCYAPTSSPTIAPTVGANPDDIAMCGLVSSTNVFDRMALSSLPGWTCTGSGGSLVAVGLCSTGWNGVTCNVGKVTSIDLTNKGVSGSLPSNLGLLTEVTYINLEGNSFVGTIPTSIGSMKKLVYLHLTSNKFSGALPLAFSSLTNLQTLNMNGNKITSIPSAVGSCTKLSILNLQYNTVGSTIPNVFSKLVKLTQVYLNNNAIGGPIPATVGSLSLVLNLHLNDNSLTSVIPSSFSNLLVVQTIGLQNNKLSGTISSGLGQLTNMVELKLNNNKLGGSIPNSFTLLTKLSTLHANGNSFTGYPITLCSISSLTNFYYSTTSHQCVLPTAAPTSSPASSPEHLSICDLIASTNIAGRKSALGWAGWTCSGTGTSRVAVGLCVNFWSGVICSGNSVTSLQLPNSQISGSVPASIGSLTSLVTLDLGGNSLMGNIPGAIGCLTNLQTLRLSTNSMTSSIPSQISALNKLETLQLDNNKLAGPLADALGALVKLTKLELHNNLLTGAIPVDISVLTNLQVLSLHSNTLSLSVPASLGAMTKLRVLTLSFNALDGLPSAIGSLTLLEKLDVGSNFVSSSIPASFSKLGALKYLSLRDANVIGGVSVASNWANIEYLYLDTNQMNGNILALSTLTKLVELSLHSNSFTGSVPSGFSAMTKLTQLQLYGTSLLNNFPVQLCSIPGLHFTLTSLTESQCTMPTIAPTLSPTKSPTLSPTVVPTPVLTPGSSPIHIAMCDLLASTNIADLKAGAPGLWNGWTCTMNGAQKTANNLCSNPTWTGVVCSGNDVVAIFLNQHGIAGTLPSTIGNLVDLQLLYLTENSISGSLPESIGSLTNLLELLIGLNSIDGSIPATISKLHKLQQLSIYDNDMIGTIPTGIGSLTDLQYFTAYGNSFEGSIPATISAMQSLLILNLGDNKLSGKIPSEIGQIDLVQVSLHDNKLTGPIPYAITKLTNMAELSVVNNLLTSYPGGICNMATLTRFYWSSMNIHQCSLITASPTIDPTAGPLSAHIALCDLITSTNIAAIRASQGWSGWECTGSGASREAVGLCAGTTWTGVTCVVVGMTEQITALVLDSKGITGSLPSSIGYLTDLITFDISHNSLENSLPSSIGSMHNLVNLRINNNRFIGSLPSSLGLLSKLEIMQLSSNSFNGGIPSEIGLLSSLDSLSISSVPIGGEIPLSFSLLTKLTFLAVDSCSLVGSIPSGFGSLGKVTMLLLQSNSLVGSIPSTIGSMTALRTLQIDGNRLNGQIPATLGSLTSLTLLALNSNCLSGMMPESLSLMSSLERLKLQSNSLTGEIPSTLGSLTGMLYMHLNSNLLVGSLPSSLGSLAKLIVLDAYSNSITGAVPQSFTKLTALSTLSLHSTKMNGQYPFELCSMSGLVTFYLSSTITKQCLIPTSIPTAAPTAEAPPPHLALCDMILTTNIVTRLSAVFVTEAIGWACTGNDREAVGLCGDITWKGVTCTGTKITGLHLPMMEITGSLPSTFGYMTDMLSIDLNSNSLAGSIPESIGSMTKLTKLVLSENDFIGTLPSTITQLVSLTDLNLNMNSLDVNPAFTVVLTNLQRLQLGGCGISGSISSDIAALTNLVTLMLNSNDLDGSLPATLGSLVNLEELIVDDNSITGSLPLSITKLSKLRILSIRHNSVTGNIPSSISKLAELEEVYFNNNNIIGTLPASFSALTKLRALHLHENKVGGSIPGALGLMSSLNELGMSDNTLVGTIPEDLGLFSGLTHLALENNYLSGSIPSTIGSIFTLAMFHAANNMLTGSIPDSFSSLTQLESLDVHGNKLISTYPSALCDMSLLTTFLLMHNDTHQCYAPTSSPTSSPTDISWRHAICDFIAATNIPNLVTLGVLTGWTCVEDDFGSLHAADLCLNSGWQYVTCNDGGGVAQISLRYVGLSGTLSESIGFLTDLEVLSLSGNNLTGNIPTSIGKMEMLHKLNLRDNSLGGTLPSSLGQLTALTTLDVSSNFFTGNIPESLTHLVNLEYFYAHATSIVSYPADFCTSFSFLVEFYLRGEFDECAVSPTATPTEVFTTSPDEAICDFLLETNINNLITAPSSTWEGWECMFEGAPSPIGLCTSAWTGVECVGRTVVGIRFKNSDVEGYIPESIGFMTGLTALDLGGSKFAGTIPESIGSLTRLTTVDLHDNDISGTIPTSLGNLLSLQSLILSHNNLTGVVPETFVKLTKLTALHLQNNKLQRVYPAGLCSFLNLQEFLLSSSELNECSVPTLAPTPTFLIPQSIHDGMCALLSSISVAQQRDRFDWDGWTCIVEEGVPTAVGLCLSNWHGVVCDGNKVVQISLNNNQLTGTLTTSIGLLTDLRTLVLSHNELDSSIPSTIGLLVNLETLHLTSSGIFGPIPESIGSMTKLQELILSQNALTGSIPESITNLLKLRMLHLSGTDLDTVYDEAICELPSLVEFYLTNDDLDECSTSVPSSAPTMVIIEVPRATQTAMCEFIAASNLAALKTAHGWQGWRCVYKLNVWTASDVCSWYSITCENGDVVEIAMSSKDIQGSLPDSISNLMKLRSLLLDDNKITGTIPISIGIMTNLDILRMDFNSFTGQIPSQIGNMISLREIYLQHNALTGALPTTIAKLELLQTLDVHGNSFTVNNSQEVCAMPSMQKFYFLNDSVNECAKFTEIPSNAPSAVPSAVPTAAPSKFPTNSPSMAPIETSSPSSSPTTPPTSTASAVPTSGPSADPTPASSAVPTSAPSAVPTSAPSAVPTSAPSVVPTSAPSKLPTIMPSRSSFDTLSPSSNPTYLPTNSPTHVPSFVPSAAPTFVPTSAPVAWPTLTPTSVPTSSPAVATTSPTTKPTAKPTLKPTVSPTVHPSFLPSHEPTLKPTRRPTLQPSYSQAPQLFPTTKAPTAKPSRFPTPIPEVPPSIIFIESEANRTTIALTIVLTGDGSVYCGIFSTGKVPSSVAEVVSQNHYSIASDHFATLIISGAIPATSYDIYCNAMSPGGYVSSYFSMIDMKHTVTTLCCKMLSVDLLTNVVMENAATFDMITIFAENPPSTSITLSVQITGTAGVLNPFFPTAISFTPTSWSPRKLTMKEVLSGEYYLSVGGAPTTEFSIEYSRGRNISVLSVNTELPPPTLLRAQFSWNGLSIDLYYSAATDRMRGQQSFKCSDLLSFVGAAESTCNWKDDSVATVMLSNKVVLEVGSILTVLGGKVRAKCTLVNTNDCLNWQTVPVMILNVQAPTSPIRPTVVVFGPSVAGSCDTPVLDLSSSTGSGGRSWKSIGITVLSAHTESAANLQTFFQTVYKLTPPTAIPKNYLRVNYYYDITFTLCNFFGQCGQSTHRITVADTTAPTVAILGSKFRSQITKTVLSLSSSSFIPTCEDTPDSTKLAYQWTVYENGMMISVANEARDASKLRVAPFVLKPLQSYIIELTVRNTDSQLASSVSVMLDVAQGQLFAVISGGSSQSLRFGETLSLHGRNSYDEDGIRSVASNIAYTWSCYQREPVFNSSCVLLITPSNNQNNEVSIATTSLAAVNSVHVVTMAYSDSTRQSRSSVIITISSPSSPIVAITTAFATKPNPAQQLRLSARVQSTYSTVATWSVSDASVSLQKVSLSNVANAIIPGVQTVNLVLQSNALSGATSEFTFTLHCDAASASILVKFNTPPGSGKFSMNPASGTELNTSYSFTAYDWTDDDLPLTFEFGYVRVTDNVRMTLRTRAELSYTSSQLPAGNTQSSMQLSGFVRVFDGYDAESLSLFTVVVNKLQLSSSEVTKKASEQISQMGNTVDDAKTTISLVTSLLNQRDCSSAPNCTVRNRHGCANVDNTCGKCLSGYVGVDGDSNTICRQAGQANPVTCSTNDDCSSVDYCSASQCLRRSKICECSGHGTCSFRLVDTGTVVTTCLIGNSKCEASCACDSGYSGSKCGVSSDELAEKQELRKQLLAGLSNMADRDEATADTLVGWVSGLTAVTQHVDELSDDGVTAAIAVADKIISTASSLGIGYDKLLGLLDTVNAATIASFASSSRRRLTGESATALTVLDEFGTLAASGMILGQRSVDAVYDLFSISSQVVQSETNAYLSLPQSETDTDIGAVQSYGMITADTGDDIQAVVTSTSAKIYSDTFSVNPFRMKLLNGAGIDEAYLVLQSIMTEEYPELQSNITYNTTCLEDDWSSYVYICPGLDGRNITVTHECNGTVAVISTTCPIMRRLPQCYIVSGTDYFECEVTEYSSTNITCRCWAKEPDRRRLSFGVSDTGLLEVAAISVYVADTFVTTVSTAEDFDSLEDVRRVLIVILMYGTMWACGMSAIALFSWRSRKAKQRKKFFTLPKHTSYESIRQRLNKYIDAVLPEVFNDDSAMARLYREIKRHHRYIQVFTATGSESEKARVITGVHLLTVQTMLMFILAVLYDTEFPADNGSCASKITEESCLQDSSIFDRSKTTCRWNVNESGEEECIYADRDLTWNMVIIISLVVAIFTSPANSFIDFIFIDILSAPTADVHKVAAASVTDKIQRRMSNAVRRASAVGDALMVAIQKRTQKKKRQSSIFTTTRVLPEYAIEAYSQARASSREVLTSALAFQQQYDQGRKSKRVTAVVPTTDPNVIEDVPLSVDEMMEALRVDIVAQRNTMKRTEQMLFDLKWGLDNRGYFLRGRVASGPISLCFPNDSDVGMTIRRELEAVRKESEEKIEKLQLATDVQIGMELLHVFILDLLGRDSVAARVFQAKSEEDFKHKLVVSRMQKRLLWMFVIALNLFFVYFSMLRGLERGAEWQRNFATACVIQFIVEMLLFETSECVIMNFVIPSVVTTEVRNAFLSVKEIIHNVCSGMYANYQFPLDVPLYLFVSTQIATEFPHLMESVIVRSYHTYMPAADWSRQWHQQLGMSRWSWRNIARSLTITAIVTNVIRYFAVLPGEVQRLIVHMFQPIVLSGFLIAWLLIEENPLYAVVPIVVVCYLTYVIWKDVRRHRVEKVAPHLPNKLDHSVSTREESKSGVDTLPVDKYDIVSDEESPRRKVEERDGYELSSDSDGSEAEFGSISSSDSSIEEGVWSPSSVDRNADSDRSLSSTDIRQPTSVHR